MLTKQQNLSREIIKLITERLEEEFGITVTMGAELEFGAFSELGHNLATYPRIYSLTPSGERRDHAKHPLFPDSPYISNLYKEGGLYRHEIVLSHLAEHGGPIVLPRVIQATKNLILNEAENFKIDHISLDPVSPFSKDQTHSMQINIGLENAISRKSIFGHSYKYTPDSFEVQCMLCIGNHMLSPLNEGIILMAPNDTSYERYNLQDKALKISSHKTAYSALVTRNTYATNYFELRLAGADADPYEVVAGAMINIYHALSQKQDIEISNGKLIALNPHVQTMTGVEIAPMPQSLNEGIKRFKNGTIIKPLLNDLRPNLGDEFHESILARPRNLDPNIIPTNSRSI